MRYANADHTVIDTGDNRFVPVDPDNLDYAAIVASGDVVAPFALEQQPEPTRLAKADLWRRLDDEEVETLNSALHAAPLRLRLIFEAAEYLDTTDDDYPALRGGIEAALGEERAAVVLAPTY